MSNCEFCTKKEDCLKCRYKLNIKCSFGIPKFEEYNLREKPTCKSCQCVIEDLEEKKASPIPPNTKVLGILGGIL